jgi:hypothetical protein
MKMTQQNEQEKTTIDMVNGLAEIADYMKDEELTIALTMIAKLIIKPDIPPHVASLEIVRLQAIAAKMSFLCAKAPKTGFCSLKKFIPAFPLTVLRQTAHKNHAPSQSRHLKVLALIVASAKSFLLC